jgi:hypothetical protein
MLRKKPYWMHFRSAVKFHTFHTSYLESERGCCKILYSINHTKRQEHLRIVIHTVYILCNNIYTVV